MGKEVAPDFIPFDDAGGGAPDFIPFDSEPAMPKPTGPRVDMMAPAEAAAAKPKAPLPQTGVVEAGVRGGLQGISSKYGDEVAAALDWAMSHNPTPGAAKLAQLLHDPRLPPIDDPSVSYRDRRDAYRTLRVAGEAQHPLANAIGDVGGQVAQAALTGPARGLAASVGKGAAMGAARGAGGAQELSDVPTEAGVGALEGGVTGAVAGGAMKAVGKAAGGASATLKDAVKATAKGAAGVAAGHGLKKALEAGGMDHETAGMVGGAVQLLSGAHAAHGLGSIGKPIAHAIAKAVMSKPELARAFVQAVGQKAAEAIIGHDAAKAGSLASAPGDEAAYQKWRGSLPKNLQYEGDYDLRGFWRENPNFKPDDPTQHLTDKFKLPNHPTFSNESQYYNDQTKHLGGHWEDLPGGGSRYVPNDPRFKKQVDEP